MEDVVLIAVVIVAAFSGISAAAGQADAQTDDVVVVANRHRCDLSIANRVMTDREFRAKAAEWAAGKPVQVHVPAGSSYRCQAKILFKLHRYGVHRANFIE